MMEVVFRRWQSYASRERLAKRTPLRFSVWLVGIRHEINGTEGK